MSQTLEERREQAGGRGEAARSRRVGVEEQPACARRGTREARPLRVVRARAGRSFARGRWAGPGIASRGGQVLADLARGGRWPARGEATGARSTWVA